MVDTDAKGRFLLLSVLLVMLLTSWVGKASACALEQSANYMVMLQGSNQLNIKLPLYDKEGSDCWLVEGIVYIQIEGQEKEMLFHCTSQTDIGSDDYAPYIYCYAGVDGTMVLNRARGNSKVTIGRSLMFTTCPCVENLEYAMVDLTWKDCDDIVVHPPQRKYG